MIGEAYKREEEKGTEEGKRGPHRFHSFFLSTFAVLCRYGGGGAAEVETETVGHVLDLQSTCMQGRCDVGYVKASGPPCLQWFWWSVYTGHLCFLFVSPRRRSPGPCASPDAPPASLFSSLFLSFLGGDDCHRTPVRNRARASADAVRGASYGSEGRRQEGENEKRRGYAVRWARR